MRRFGVYYCQIQHRIVSQKSSVISLYHKQFLKIQNIFQQEEKKIIPDISVILGHESVYMDELTTC